MKRHTLTGVMAAGACTVVVLLGLTYARTGNAGQNPHPAAANPYAAPTTPPQPDTTSPDWKPLSDDLGIWIGKSDTVGLRGRLYVRLGDSWWPVAIDGASDIRGIFPVR